MASDRDKENDYVYQTHNPVCGPSRLPAVLALLLPLALGCKGGDPNEPNTFSTPQAAAEAMITALEQSDGDALLDLVGHKYRDQYVTADWDAEEATRQRIAAAARESLELEAVDDARVMVVGSEEWPVPIPIVQVEGGWIFDGEAGSDEVVNRRIGRNELAAIAMANAYVDAQIEYAREDRNDDGILEYAQRLASQPGQRDGLYWPAEPGEELSPFGPLVIEAEHYLKTTKSGDPLKGYYFQILTRQGENAPGGRYDYMINDRLLAGFALVAYPADYGNTGVMTFIVNHQGKVYQKDLEQLASMDEYGPEDTWTLVEE
jgi:hypothetical protein